MSISSAMNAGVSGLAANSSRLGTISDNIANASTFGYKRVETDFNALVVGRGRAFTPQAAFARRRRDRCRRTARS